MRPNEAILQKLIYYKIATIVDNKYTYSLEFKESVEYLRKNPPGRLKQARLAKEVDSKIVPALVTYASSIKSKRKIENIIIAYVCLKTHLARLNIGIHSDELPNIVYGTFYLNDNEPEVWEKEEEMDNGG